MVRWALWEGLSVTPPPPSPLSQWEAPLARGLRGALCSFLELLGLVLETIESFGGAGQGEATPPPQ